MPMVAAEVFPNRAMLDGIFSGGILRASRTARLMRSFAWCAMKQSISSWEMPVVSQI
jgi:hypothetical protein